MFLWRKKGFCLTFSEFKKVFMHVFRIRKGVNICFWVYKKVFMYVFKFVMKINIEVMNSHLIAEELKVNFLLKLMPILIINMLSLFLVIPIDFMYPFKVQAWLIWKFMKLMIFQKQLEEKVVLALLENEQKFKQKRNR